MNPRSCSDLNNVYYILEEEIEQEKVAAHRPARHLDRLSIFRGCCRTQFHSRRRPHSQCRALRHQPPHSDHGTRSRHRAVRTRRPLAPAVGSWRHSVAVGPLP